MYNTTSTSTNDGSVFRFFSLWFVIFGVVFSIICTLLTLQGNMLVLRLFIKHRSNLLKPSNMFFLSMCLSDVCFAIMVFPLEAVYLINHPNWSLGNALCKLWQSLYAAFGAVSIFSLSAMSVERYLAIRRPFHHVSRFTMSRAVLMSCILWAIGTLSGVFYYHVLDQPHTHRCIQSNVTSPEHAIVILLLNIFIPFLICLVAYHRIFVIAKQQAKRHEQQKHLNNQTNDFTFQEQINQKNRNSKAKKTISWLVGAFALFCLPFVIYHVMDATLRPRFEYKSQLEHIVKWISFMNSTCNWALYTLFNRELRGPLLALLPDCVSYILGYRNRIEIANDMT